MKIELCVIASILVGTSAWLFSRDRVVQADGEVDSTCQGSGAEGSCEFYNCFERRFPCRARGYMLRFGYHYCQRFEDVDNYRHEFNPQAQNFLTASQQCMTKKLSEQFYSENQVNCHDLEHAAFRIMGDCYLEKGFCDIFWDNREAFAKVFDSGDLFDSSSLKIWKQIGKMTLRCGGQSAGGVFSFIRSKIMSWRDHLPFKK
ncbi:hypothetical protein LOTGIDRAFT_234508 [Lottia gigantea]|uniref:Stanniocalcin n=1 Tax=Lottia gigantea TaxID=225164 RepID=V4A5B6_LOTGI|nr:hypothetical protein LOTGIDRAFT_234508 [Lottia gigantea]ESO88441.1 hypothetical protein LOTGIDRAFT_234508 [Lottia gigantea]